MDAREGDSVRPGAVREFVVSRVLDAPRALVWKAWTDPEHLTRWWGPKGLTVKVARLDLRPGGVFHYGMHSPDGQEMWAGSSSARSWLRSGSSS